MSLGGDELLTESQIQSSSGINSDGQFKSPIPAHTVKNSAKKNMGFIPMINL